jgi:hypothetical protein
MIQRSVSALIVAVSTLAINASSAFAQKAGGSDPTKIGENVKSIVTPNAKAFWWIFLVGGLLFMAASRKAGRAVGMGILLLVSGIAIWNPVGVTSMMSGFADRVF